MSFDLEAELDHLYDLPPGEFTAARNELARRLKDAGERESAEELQHLRKPTNAVWLANRLARGRKLDVQRLTKIGEALMEGQSGSKESFSEARRQEQQTLRQLAQAAKEIAAREGVGAAAADRAIETLRAAALDREARVLLRRGRLTQELDPPGLEALQALARSATGARRTAARKTAPGKPTPRDAQARLRDLRAEERRRIAAAQEAERAAARAEVVASNLRKEAEAAKAKVEEAAERTGAAEQEAERLRQGRH